MTHVALGVVAAGPAADAIAQHVPTLVGDRFASRMADSASAASPHSVWSWAKSRLATLSATRVGTCAATASAAAPVAATSSVLTPWPSRARR